MPAFPVVVRYENGKPVSYQNGETTGQEIGLTKREMIAAQMNVSKDIEDWSTEFFEELLGRKIPGNAQDNYLFWAEAEARIRVIKADALLTELSKA